MIRLDLRCGPTPYYRDRGIWLVTSRIVDLHLEDKVALVWRLRDRHRKWIWSDRVQAL